MSELPRDPTAALPAPLPGFAPRFARDGVALAAFRGRSYTMKGKPLIEGMPTGKMSAKA